MVYLMVLFHIIKSDKNCQTLFSKKTYTILCKGCNRNAKTRVFAKTCENLAKTYENLRKPTKTCENLPKPLADKNKHEKV